MMCRRVTELMTEAMEGSLAGTEKVAFDVHMVLCPYCRRHRTQVETTVATLGKMPELPVSEASREHALDAFRARRHRRV